jgi:hypothetical protein
MGWMIGAEFVGTVKGYSQQIIGGYAVVFRSLSK